MPIRHCQKCGMKVLVDETQLASNPFYCQRCASSLAGETKRSEAPPENHKPAPVKVVCPLCKGAFTGRIPSKAAKGACPICRKELVLLPNGEIVSAQEYAVQKAMEPTTGDQLAAAKRALERTRPPVPMPVEEREVEQTIQVSPEQEVDQTILAEPDPTGSHEPVVEEELPPPPEPEPEPVQQRVEPPKPPTPPPPKVEAKPTKPASAPTVGPPQKLSRGLQGRPQPTVPQQVVVLPKPSLGKAILALVFFFLPLLGGTAFWKLRDGGMKNVVTKLGAFGSKGLHKVYLTLRKQG